MKITFKLYANLSDYLPDTASNTSAVELEVKEGTTVDDLIAQFHLPVKMCHLVLVDGVFVPRQARPGRVLCAGETLAIWPPVAGG